MQPPCRAAAIEEVWTYLPGPSQDAVVRGDISNTAFHPFFIHATAGLGMRFCPGVGHLAYQYWSNYARDILGGLLNRLRKSIDILWFRYLFPSLL